MLVQTRHLVKLAVNVKVWNEVQSNVAKPRPGGPLRIFFNTYCTKNPPTPHKTILLEESKKPGNKLDVPPVEVLEDEIDYPVMTRQRKRIPSNRS